MTQKSFTSVNPYTDQELRTWDLESEKSVDKKLGNAWESFLEWRLSPTMERRELLYRIASLLEARVESLAKMMTLEMGKPITQARSEVNKCAWVCRYYADHGVEFLQDELITTDASDSFVRYDPLGVILAIMPWNFPYWQFFRFAAPALMAGNGILLKHSPSTLGSAELLSQLFRDAKCPAGLFGNLIIDVDQVPGIISDQRIKSVTLTGSVRAGSAVAEIAGREIKKTVLELGGSNAFVVLSDADLEKAVEVGIQARYMNTGQSCIAAKRFILHEAIADEFTEAFVARVKELEVGDPLQEATYIGPMARKDLAEELESQLKRSVEKGAKLLAGGERKGAHFSPTVLGDVRPGMAAFDEETFGPLAAITVAEDEEEAIELANQTAYGLGVSLFTEDLDLAYDLIPDFKDGAVFVNGLVKSDPRLPFGGTGKSGYGRELSKHGILEFCNAKTVWIG